VTPTPILHADLDAFFASVEQRDDPALRDRPVIVGRGVVLACSYEAKARGVKTAMNGREAMRLCPEAVVVPPRMSAYTEASEAVYGVFERTSPLVEGLSIDEAFLDVGGLEHISGTPAETAGRLRREVLAEVGLKISVGVARTKFLAKVASGQAKPDGLLVVPADREQEFLHPLPVERLWGVGRVTTRKLNEAGIRTVGEIAATDGILLGAIIGESAAGRLLDLAHNRDPRKVKPREPRRSIGAQSAFPRGSRLPGEIEALMASLVDRVTRRLRAAGKSARTVSVDFRFGDFSRASRARTLPAATDRTDPILATAREIFEAAGPEIDRRGLTLVGVSVANLDSDGAVQMELPLAGRETSGLDTALDAVRDRFGSAAITRASLIDADRGVEAPTLPD
jgi:DNA polymerase IV